MNANPIAQAATEFLSKNVTKVGMIGVTIYLLSQLALGIIHKSADTILQALGYGGLSLIGWGAAMRSKRTADIVVTATAEAAVNRALIANAVTPPDVQVVPQSADPAIQRQIDKIQRDSK